MQAEDSVAAPDWLGEPVEEKVVPLAIEEPAAPDSHATRPRSTGIRMLGALLLVLAIAWVAAAAWSIWLSRPALTIPNAVGWVATLSGPLILLALLWMWLGRASRRETERMSLVLSELRSEGVALESVLAIVAQRLEENHARLRGEAEKLMSLGDEASDRLGRVTYYLSKESAALDKGSASLESAAAAAKVDIGVLLNDLPRAEEQARAVAEAMKEAGLTAHGHAGALEAQVAALAARGREADEIVGGAAERLGAHVARIESGSAAAAASMNQASAAMNAAIDGAMARAAEAVDATRSGLEAQGAAMLATVEQSRAALEGAGEDAARNLAQRLETLSGKMETLAGQLAAQDAASHALVTGLGKELVELDDWFTTLGRTGSAQTEKLTASVNAARDVAKELIEEIGGGSERAAELTARAAGMAEALSAAAAGLSEQLPAAFEQAEERAAAVRESAQSLAPMVEGVQSSAETAAARIAEAEQSIARQREALDALLARIEEGSASAEEQLQKLGAAAGEAEGAATRITAETGPELIDALVRVREAANQAAERAREAIASVIPESAAALADAGRKALGEAMSETVEQQLSEMSELSARAMTAARDASERLTRQMLALGDSARTIEERIDSARREQEERESEAFSRRVALLIESLNSTAIDVTKILSNEVTDSAWASYLKGDRGVFTRRAVRLLDNVETREIARHYEEEPEFREQVNRYIHDFEAMLRRILAEREGSPLGVTILSSDMGKLYVALAQAIERLRT
ncbi:MAG TPA: hypothetical protein VIT45_09040 [Allosphingosinicella sp.]